MEGGKIEKFGFVDGGRVGGWRGMSRGNECERTMLACQGEGTFQTRDCSGREVVKIEVVMMERDGSSGNQDKSQRNSPCISHVMAFIISSYTIHHQRT